VTAVREPVLDEPVIVLTGARSGSTLLRLILDTHPDLACVPETNIVKTCAQFADAFDIIGQHAGTAARPAIEAMVAGLFGDYLRGRDRLRWCDKSLGTAAVAEWFLTVYPKATFICLYRHCMDVVHSAIEASPWGLTGYGFEEFAGGGGNSVAALTAYWIEHTRRILEFERAHPDRCVRLHYEHLVQDPERTVAQVFSAIGVPPVPGITGRCFGTTAPVTGPGDHKVTATRRITADSVGRGIRVPVGAIPPPQLMVVNHLLTELDYTPVDEAWLRSARPPALLPDLVGPSEMSLGGLVAQTLLEKVGDVMHARAVTGMRRALPEAGSGTFKLVAYHTDRQRSALCWLLDPAGQTIRAAEVDTATDWMVTGDVETWLGILADRANMASCVRSGALRYVPLRDEAHERHSARATTMERRLSLVRRILGLAGYPEEVSGRDDLPAG
jgi:hypothetical protein